MATTTKEVADLLLEQVNVGERRIMRVLRDYPNISSSMIGIHVRPVVGPMWKKFLERLVADRAVIRYMKERPNGTTYEVYRLATIEDGQFTLMDTLNDDDLDTDLDDEVA